jgi:hypothetical protein
MLALVWPCAGLLKDHPCAASGSFLGGGSVVNSNAWLVRCPNGSYVPLLFISQHGCVQSRPKKVASDMVRGLE